VVGSFGVATTSTKSKIAKLWARLAELQDDVERINELLSVEAAATQLSIGRTTMYALIKTGAITSVRIGRLRRIPAEALTAYTTRLIAE